MGQSLLACVLSVRRKWLTDLVHTLFFKILNTAMTAEHSNEGCLYHFHDTTIMNSFTPGMRFT